MWGHSQGGHASLFTGQLAATYAPELRLVGVAAGAPVPNLIDLFRVNMQTRVGKILIAIALHSWARVYDTAELSHIVTPAARGIVAGIAENCLYGRRQILASVPGALLLGLTFVGQPLWDVEPWRSIAEENSPTTAATEVPMLIVQGGADTSVDPATTERFVDELCANGATASLRTYPDVGHLETGHEAVPDVAAWLADRFAGEPAPTTGD